MSRNVITQRTFCHFYMALLTILGAHSAQAQMVCEPENSPRCRYLAACLKPPPPPKKGPGPAPLSQEACSCVWDVLARAFPAEEHTLLAEHAEALAAGREDQEERVRAILPDESKRRAFIEKWINTLFTAGKNKECSHQ